MYVYREILYINIGRIGKLSVYFYTQSIDLSQSVQGLTHFGVLYFFKQVIHKKLLSTHSSPLPLILATTVSFLLPLSFLV